jgi:hypothetical protein
MKQIGTLGLIPNVQPREHHGRDDARDQSREEAEGGVPDAQRGIPVSFTLGGRVYAEGPSGAPGLGSTVCCQAAVSDRRRRAPASTVKRRQMNFRKGYLMYFSWRHAMKLWIGLLLATSLRGEKRCPGDDTGAGNRAR